MGLPVSFHGLSIRPPTDLVAVVVGSSLQLVVCPMQTVYEVSKKKLVSYWGQSPLVSSCYPKGPGLVVHSGSPGRQERTPATKS